MRQHLNIARRKVCMVETESILKCKWFTSDDSLRFIYIWGVHDMSMAKTRAHLRIFFLMTRAGNSLGGHTQSCASRSRLIFWCMTAWLQFWWALRIIFLVFDALCICAADAQCGVIQFLHRKTQWNPGEMRDSMSTETEFQRFWSAASPFRHYCSSWQKVESTLIYVLWYASSHRTPLCLCQPSNRHQVIWFLPES